MRNVNRYLAAIALALFSVSVAGADTLELKSGKVVQGRYLGGTQTVLRFEVNGEVQTFNTNEIVALTFTGHSGSAAPAAATTPAPYAPASAPAGGEVTIPAGQRKIMSVMFSTLAWRPT